MPNTYKHSGQRVQAVSGGIRVSGGIYCDPQVAGGTVGIVGIAQSSAVSGDTYWLECTHVHNVAVPSGTVANDKLYAPGAPPTLSGAPVTQIVLTKTSASNSAVGRALTTRDAAGNADVLFLPITY